MPTAFERLDIDEDANDQDIKQAYLNKVKEFPPERHPEQFQLVRKAFDNIKDIRKRIEYSLFQSQSVDLNSLMSEALASAQPQKAEVQQLLQLLQETLKPNGKRTR